MHIGLVTQWFASGAGHVSRNYSQVLAKNHRVFIYARGGPILRDDLLWGGSEVTWAPRHPLATGIHPGHFKRWIKRHSIDTVLFNEQRVWAGVVLSKQLGKKTGAYVDYYTQDTVPFFHLYDFLICNTQRHYGVFKDHPQCCFVKWGTQTDLYRPASTKITRPLTFIVNAGWSGRNSKAQPWMDRRGTGLAMRTFQRVKGDCRMVVFSQAPLASCPSDWIESVSRDSRISFRSGTFEPFPYGDGDVYVYPSRLDGIGLTLPEALSSGLAAIATDSPPMNEFVSHQENGLLVPVGVSCARPDGYYWPESLCDEEALVDAMGTYVRDTGLAQAHGAQARLRAENELCWERNAHDLAGWIEAQQCLPVDLAGFARSCSRYDLLHSPTPIQQMLLGGNSLVRDFIKVSERD